ncbi:hypothetical protein BDZ97DRAFT_1727934 [Flammula alnicola]|nr:hypothetical protein BDZ97DRAFT_1727934 [Flammula alnicola]
MDNVGRIQTALYLLQQYQIETFLLVYELISRARTPKSLDNFGETPVHRPPGSWLKKGRLVNLSRRRGSRQSSKLYVRATNFRTVWPVDTDFSTFLKVAHTLSACNKPRHSTWIIGPLHLTIPFVLTSDNHVVRLTKKLKATTSGYRWRELVLLRHFRGCQGFASASPCFFQFLLHSSDPLH